MCIWDVRNVKLKLQILNNWSQPFKNIAITEERVAAVDGVNIYINDLSSGKEMLKYQLLEDAEAQLMPKTVCPLLFSPEDPNTLIHGTRGMV